MRLFFFQAEDGIRDKLVTSSDVCSSDLSGITGFTLPGMIEEPGCKAGSDISPNPPNGQIGRASCRERV